MHAPMYASMLMKIRERKGRKKNVSTLNSDHQSLWLEKAAPRDALNIVEADSIPYVSFQSEWESEFVRTDYQVRTILAACCIGAIFFPISFLYGYFKGDDSRVAGGDKLWILFTWGPHLACGVILSAFVVIFTLPSLHNFCIRNYNSICASFCAMIYVLSLIHI